MKHRWLQVLVVFGVVSGPLVGCGTTRLAPAKVVGVVEVCGDPYPHASPAEGRHCTLQAGHVSILAAGGGVVAHGQLTRGRFSFSLRPGRYTLIAWNEGNGPWKLRVRALAGRDTHADVVITAI